MTDAIETKGVVVKADMNLYYPAVEKFRRVIDKACNQILDDASQILLIDFERMAEIDYTALKVILFHWQHWHR